MFVSHDDIFRIILMTLLFAVLFPLSMSNSGRRKGFSATQWLHIGCALCFTFDQIRRSSHAQVFDVPIVALYFVDRFIGLLWFRRSNVTLIHKAQLDDDYVVIFLEVQKGYKVPLASTFYLSLPNDTSSFEMSHPFIGFQNRTTSNLLPEWRDRDQTSGAHKFFVVPEADAAEGKKKFRRRETVLLEQPLDDRQQEEGLVTEETDDVVFFSKWNIGIVLQVQHDRAESFTKQLEALPIGSRLHCWGPYRSEYSDLTPSPHLPPMVLIGTGAGCAPILDFYLLAQSETTELSSPVTCYFSTQSLSLFQFITDLVCTSSLENWSVNAHLTSNDDLELEEIPAGRRTSDRSAAIGRLSFLEVLREAPPNAHVYFCGSEALQWKVEVAAKECGLQFHPGHKFSSSGSIKCTHLGRGKGFACRCSKFPCCWSYF